MKYKAIKTICIFLVLLAGKAALAQRLIVQEEVIKVAGITDDVQIYGLNASQKQTTRYYSDGLGRLIQTNAVKGSPLQKDIIQFNKYDSLGRQTTGHLPYVSAYDNGSFRSAALTEQLAFYSNGTGDKVADDASPFSKQVFENSPLQRLLQSGSVGNGFQPGQHYKTSSYRQNTSTDAVISWSPLGVNTGNYAVGSLSATAVTDEAGTQVIVFGDASGRTVLKREIINEVIGGTTVTKLDTYYIYNEAGSLAWTIPPKAVAVMQAAANWSLTQTAVNKLIYSYVYDNRGRLIEKKVPDCGVMYVIYDPLSRPVLVQDAKLRLANKWNYIKYDYKNRAISQGIYVDATRTSRTAMQSYVDGLNYSTVYFEGRSSSGTNGYYTNSVFPTTGLTPLSYSYYDDYDLDQNGTADYSYQAQGLTAEASPTAYTRGMSTILRKRSLGSGLSDIWLTEVTFYDKRGNAIQARSNNHLNVTIADSKTVVPDFTGKPVQVKTVKVTSVTTTVLSSYSYDHSERLKTVDDSYNGATALRVAAYEYNELGQLVKKRLHSADPMASYPADVTLGSTNSVANGAMSNVQATNSIVIGDGFAAASGSSFSAAIVSGTYLQNVDYRYNIRGSLTSINNSTLTNDGIKNDDSNDVFGMEILYDQADASLGNTVLFNGLTSAIKWKAITPGTSNPKERAYRFNYDTRNQLKNALYSNRATGAGSWTSDGAFDEKNIGYDHNGNITGLKRNALISGAVAEVDNLTYTYTGNQLSNVSDGVGANYTAVGFKNPSGSAVAYTYDVNGNLDVDDKKKLDFDYNELNKTEKITVTNVTGRYISYTYGADGVLLRKQAYDNNILQKTTDYIEGFVYENSALAYFAMAEGRVRYTGSVLKPEYMITDHQGNVRVSFEDNAGLAEVRQENSYYPYGLIMPGGMVPSQPNRNLYNGGSEWQNDFADMPDLYQTHYRNYDPALGRFVGVDPLADEMHSLSVYQYGNNNPVMFNDPVGDQAARLSQETLYLLGAAWEAGGDYGASFGGGGFKQYTSAVDAFGGITDDLDRNGWWGGTVSKNFDNSWSNFHLGKEADGKIGLRSVGITEARSNPNWVTDRQREVFGDDAYENGYVYNGRGGMSYVGNDQPGELESFVPVWGSLKSGVNHFHHGNYWRGIGYTALAISDVFLVKSIATGIGKGGLKMLGKSYKYWSSVRSAYGKTGFAESGQHLHHWLLARNGATKGQGFGWWIKNQMWNLMPMESVTLHQSIHGVGATPFGPLRQLYYGTPNWFKSGIISTFGRMPN